MMTVLAKRSIAGVAEGEQPTPIWHEFTHVYDVPQDGRYTEVVRFNTLPGDRMVIRYTLSTPTWVPQ